MYTTGFTINTGVTIHGNIDAQSLTINSSGLTTNDITDSLNKRYVTDDLLSGITHTNRVVIDALSDSGSTLFYNGSQVGTVQIQSDWTQIDSGATDYIKHKPTIAPVNISFFKSGANGTTYPQRFKWTADLTVSEIILTSNCTNVSISRDRSGTITTYDKDTIIGIVFYSSDNLILNDMTIQAGYDNANAILVFSQN